MTKPYDVIGFTADADFYCIQCAWDIYSADPDNDNGALDREGNPVNPVFVDQIDNPEFCGSCGAQIGFSDRNLWRVDHLPYNAG